MRNIIYKRAFLFAYKSGMLNKKTALHCLNVAKHGYLTCEICKKRVGQLKQLNVDHIIPKSKNGNNEMQNLRLTHPNCNIKRQNKFKIKDPIRLFF